MTTQDLEKISEILNFWFEEATFKQKFSKDPEFDATIVLKFEETYWDIMNRKTEGWRKTPEGRLAEIIVLDQFARNMFRDSAQQFAGDERAIKLAQEAVALGADKKIDKDRRLFFYMPYMHSESKAIHKKAFWIFLRYGKWINFKYERKHKKIIDRFGRYPHRNEILGRESTPEEIEFNKKHGGF